MAWGGGRWPNVDWIDGALVWCGWEGEEAVWRRVWQDGPGNLVVEGNAAPLGADEWAGRVLGLARGCPPLRDPLIDGLRNDSAGLRGFAYGSVYDGLVTAIVGQSISLAAAAVTEARLSRAFHPGLAIGGRRYWPLPRADQLADASVALVRGSGVTWRRAEALVAVGRATMAGALPDDVAARRDPEEASVVFRTLPLVGPWTAASALIWGVGAEDVYPVGDAALLRAARAAYERPALSPTDLARAAEGWRPHRTWAARLLWAGLFDGAGAGRKETRRRDRGSPPRTTYPK